MLEHAAICLHVLGKMLQKRREGILLELKDAEDRLLNAPVVAEQFAARKRIAPPHKRDTIELLKGVSCWLTVGYQLRATP